MKKTFLMTVLMMILLAAAASTMKAQIRVNPTGVNVNSQNPTSVFLTYGQIPAGYVPAEAVWCGELMPAPAPAIGFACRPDTVFGSLPARYNLSTASGNQGFTDIMAIPPAVVRRAYQAAAAGANAGFFYVRRFVSTAGEPDQFVAVTCRLTGGGARVPFALTNVEIKTASSEKPVLFISGRETLPKIFADIKYNGTGRLKGRWEIVQPGEAPPSDEDLLTEATLPVERRGTQKRYTQIARFNHFLPPVGEFRLPLELPENFSFPVEGWYILLLRIEATDDKEGDSNLSVLGVGAGVVHSGAVASFPMPTLRFFITGRDPKAVWAESPLLFPRKDSEIDRGAPLVFAWREFKEAKAYRLDVLDAAETPVLSAILISPTTTYTAPSWLWEKFTGESASWRVVALDGTGSPVHQTPLQKISIKKMPAK